MRKEFLEYYEALLLDHSHTQLKRALELKLRIMKRCRHRSKLIQRNTQEKANGTDFFSLKEKIDYQNLFKNVPVLGEID